MRLTLTLVLAVFLSQSVPAQYSNEILRRAGFILLYTGTMKKVPTNVRVIPREEALRRFPGVSPHMRGFQVTEDGVVDPTIYLIEEDDVYQEAAKGNPAGGILLASTILHEQTHIDLGGGGDDGEKAALAAEIKFLRSVMQRDVHPSIRSTLLNATSQLERRRAALD